MDAHAAATLHVNHNRDVGAEHTTADGKGKAEAESETPWQVN